jgi:RimJ/RimL family protein N-acetyltransferase
MLGPPEEPADRTARTTMPLRRSTRVRIRPLTPSDGAAVDAVFAGLSPTSRRQRFLGPRDRLTPAMRRALLAVDGERHVALVAEAGPDRVPVGIARYVADGPGRAELAYEVVDAWHGRGVGTRLVRKLVRTARAAGVAELHGLVAADNHASLALLRRVLPQLRTTTTADGIAVQAWLVATPLTEADVLAGLAA